MTTHEFQRQRRRQATRQAKVEIFRRGLRLDFFQWRMFMGTYVHTCLNGTTDDSPFQRAMDAVRAIG